MKLDDIAKNKLQETPWFHRIDPSRLDGIHEWAVWLESILHNSCYIYETEEEDVLADARVQVGRFDGMVLEIRHNEHPPPHFHVKSDGGVDASFTIESCELLGGTVSSKDHKKIRYWHRRAKVQLIECWDSTRPTSCVVGKYRQHG